MRYQHEQQRNSPDYQQEFHHGNDINRHQFQEIDILEDNYKYIYIFNVRNNNYNQNKLI